MKVKELIKVLLDVPMDHEVILHKQRDSFVPVKGVVNTHYVDSPQGGYTIHKVQWKDKCSKRHTYNAVVLCDYE